MGAGNGGERRKRENGRTREPDQDEGDGGETAKAGFPWTIALSPLSPSLLSPWPHWPCHTGPMYMCDCQQVGIPSVIDIYCTYKILINIDMASDLHRGRTITMIMKMKRHGTCTVEHQAGNMVHPSWNREDHAGKIRIERKMEMKMEMET
jgi:hypothetical protein